mgnify:CR=1 FL=1
MKLEQFKQMFITLIAWGWSGGYAAAVEALGDSITRHLGSVGLNVEFVNA